MMRSGLTVSGRMIVLSLLSCRIAAQSIEEPGFYDETAFRTIELTFSVPDWHDQLVANWHTNDQTGEVVYLKADLVVDGVKYPDVGVEYKGQSGFLYVDGLKKPYKITMDAFVPDQELFGFDKITLNNGVRDHTLLREVICYRILRRYMPAPRANLVKLRSGTPGNMVDIGVYTNVERINKRFLDKHFRSDKGHRYKALDGRLVWLGSEVEPYRDRYQISGGDPDTAYQDLIKAIDKLNHTPPELLIEVLDEVLSIDRAIRLLVAGPVLLNGDDLRTGRNYYIYEDVAYGQQVLLPWDWDNGLGGAAETDIYRIFDLDLPLVDNLMAIAELRDRYRTFCYTMAGDLDWEVLGPVVAAFREQAEAAVLSGEHELFTREQYYRAHEQLEASIKERGNFLRAHPDLDQNYPEIERVDHLPIDPKEGETVWVRVAISASVAVSQVRLFVQMDGPYIPQAMFDDGGHMDGPAGDLVFGTAIEEVLPGKTVHYYVEAVSAGTVRTFVPATTEFRPFSFQVRHQPIVSEIFINEFMAKNDNGIQDEEGKNEDWLELFNAGSSDYDLGGHFLTDDLADAQQWAIPEVTIPAGGFLLVWCDDDVEDGSLHANFKLSATAGDIGLFSPLATGNQLLSGYSYGAQEPDVSEGRKFDGGDVWVFFEQATPLGSNHLLPGDVDGNGKVSLLDYVALINNFGLCEGPCPPLCKGDLNGDCGVDDLDFATALLQWGEFLPLR